MNTKSLFRDSASVADTLAVKDTSNFGNLPWRSVFTDPLLQDLPVIALTALQDERSRARGREAGFTEYVIKVDKDSLISSVNRYANPAERARLQKGLTHAGGLS